jgi:hypothetical protein
MRLLGQWQEKLHAAWVCTQAVCLLLFPIAAHAASGALQFDGINDYVTFGAAPGLSLSNVTLEAWVKRTGAGIGSSSGSGGVIAVPLITKGRGEGDGGNFDCNYFFGLRSTDFVLAADFEEGAAGTSPGLNHPINGTTVLAAGVWYHVAATYDGTNWALYLNGALEAQLNVGKPLRYDSIQHAALGAALQSTGAPEGAFAGVMDEVRIWNYARSISQIASNKTLQIVSAAGLVGRWSLDEGSGITATNTGSSGVNGTLTNGPVWVTGYPFEVSPTVTLTNPLTGTIFTAPTNLLLEVAAVDPDGTVTNVSYFAGANLIGRATNAPLAFTWTNPPVGLHTLTAIATDNSGLNATSTPVAITVLDAIVRLAAPTNGARFLAPAVVTLTADVLETNGPVAQVEFFAGMTSLGVVMSAPWTATWNVSALGTYSLTAIATDGSGTHTSAPVNVTIATNIPPAAAITSPAHNSSAGTPGNLAITASTTDADGTVTQVAFFTNGVLFATDSTTPFSVTWVNPPVGSHTLTAVATDNDGTTNLSSAVTVNIVNARVTRGPYLQLGTPTSARIHWRTDTATDGRVRFGTDPNFLTNTADEIALTNDHIVRLAGLAPETRYYYSVGSTTVPLAASTNYFLVTTPLPGTNRPVRAWVLGDAGTQTASQRAVRDAFYNFTTNTPRADLILMLGDNAYANGTDDEHQGAVFDMYTNVLRNAFTWSCLGNHDTGQTATPAADIPYFKMFSFPTNAEAGGMASGTEKYFSWDHANVHFVSLDSMSSSRAANGPMANWLRADLASTTQKWIVAIWHHPSYSKGDHDSDIRLEGTEMRQALVPILEEYGVDLCLYGHSHNYERSFLINGHYGLSTTFNDTMKVDAGNGRTNGTGAYLKPATPEFNRGAIYCTAGTSGQTGGGTLNHPVMFMSVNTLGSVVVDIEGDRLDFKFLTSAGTVNDHFTMLKSSEAAPPAAPTNLVATLNSSSSIRLNWANVPTNELGWELQRSLDGTSFSSLATLGANLTNYTNGSLQLFTTYHYRVRATNSVGTSDWSPITVLSTGTNALPTIAITTPTNSTALFSGSNLTVTATASDSDGSVTNVEFFLDGLRVFTDTTSPYSFVWSNAPLGSYTLTARATDDRGSNTWSSPAAITVVFSPGGTNTLVAQRSAWRYLDTGVDQGTAWRALNFDDSAWPLGLAQLGYGDGDEATVVSFGPNAGNVYITTWFRRAWVVDDPAAFSALQLRLLRDDGAVVYLNGTEVARQNMPSGTITAATLASGATPDEVSFFPSAVSAGALVAGTNVLAVEIHQSAVNSSDISFDLQLIGLSGTGALPAITRGPYLQNATTNSVVVRWRTYFPTNSVVRFSTNAATLDQTITDPALVIEHSVTVSNLTADTKYFYALTLGTNTLVGATTNHFFTTLAAPGVARPTRLWVIGDSGTANASAQSVRDAYLNYAATNGPANLWLMLGDNAYNTGLDTEYQAAVFDMYPTVLRNTPLWSTIGNHETAQQTTLSSFSYLDNFTLPQAGEAGGVASGTERYYSFDYANIHFICLDAMTSGRTADTPMFDWVRADLEATTQEWIIAFWHHPPYTKGSHDSDAESDLIQIRQNWLPVLESYGVDLVLCGHSHCYERSFPLKGHYGFSTSLTAAMKLDAGDGRTNSNGAYLKSSGDGAVYVVAGSSGQATGGSLNHPAMFLSLNELGSLVIDVNSNRLDLQMLGPSAVRDTFTIIKQLAPAPNFDRFAQQGFKARRGEFLRNGYLALTNAGPASTAGGPVTTLNDWVFYAPPGGYSLADTFPFSVTNSFGKAATGTATVSITTDNAPSQNVTVDDLGNGSFRLRCSGIPGRAYSIQFSNDLGSPVWQTLASGTADTQGVFEHIDTPPGGNRFYRTTYP